MNDIGHLYNHMGDYDRAFEWNRRVDFRIVDRNERIIDIRAIADSFYDAHGKPLLTRGILQDITESKRMEQTLVQSERMRVANELSTGMCHNLNNILSGISTPAQMLKRVIRDAEPLQDIETIIAASDRAVDLVQQLRLSVRGQVGDELHPVDINEVIRQTLEWTRPRWKEQSADDGTSIETHTELGEVPMVHGTESCVRDMLANLVFNAVEAMPEGGRIDIRTQADDEFVRMSFSDTGVGMDEEVRRRVFEPFFTTKMDVGSGLGLSTLHGTLIQWGGKIEVESTPGQGTIFTLYFPLQREA